MKRFRVGVGCALFALVAQATFVASAVEARTIQITDGVFTAIGLFGGASGTLIGNGFSFTGGGGSLGGINPSCFPCRPGDALTLHTLYSGSDLVGSGAIDGVPKHFGSTIGGIPEPSLTVEFNGSLVLPPPPASSADVTLDAPFTFTGRTFFLTPENIDLIGGGTAHVRLTPLISSTPFLWQPRQTDFAFSAVPEPGTLALIAGGVLLGLARLGKGRREG